MKTERAVNQLSLFGDAPVGDQRELPLLIAEQFSFALQTHELEGKTYFAVQDWVAGVAQTPDPRFYWNKLKRKSVVPKSGTTGTVPKSGTVGNELYAACVQLPYTATDGKSYQMDYADAVTLYEITMRMGTETGIRNRVLRYLANSGEAIDQIRRNPTIALEIGIRLTSPKTAIERATAAWLREGKDEAWIARRIEGMVARKGLTETLKAVVTGISGREYGIATGAVYQRLYEMTSAEIRAALNIPPTANIREHLSARGLKYLTLAEDLITERLTIAESVMWEEAVQVIRECAGIIGRSVREVEAYMGRSVVTGLPLLHRGGTVQ